MKKTTIILIALTFFISEVKGQIPVIIMTTTNTIGSTFSFSVEANTFSAIQVDFGDGTLVDETISPSWTLISGNLVGSQTVKVYGTGITFLDCRYNYLIALDVTKCTTLSTLACPFNQLNIFDITKNTSLTYLSCEDNLLTTLDVSKNIELKTLDCYINLLTSLDVSKNTALTNLTCSNNQLTSLDISENTALTAVSCASNQLTTLFLSNNIALTGLDCSNNRLNTLDVTKNTALTSLSCNGDSLTTLDLSLNTALTRLDCSYNHQLNNLDVTKNTGLQRLFCEYNHFTSMDLSQNAALTELYCSYNQLTFSTLPLRQLKWTAFIYAPQNSISIAKSLYTGVELDLSNQLKVNEDTTVFTWKTMGGTILTKGIDYSITNGKTVFLKGQADSIYCEMTNAAFPDFNSSNVLRTTFTKVMLITALKNIEFPGLEVYTHYKMLYINMPYNGELSIFDFSGRLVFYGPIYIGVNTLELSKTGLYLIKLTGNGERVIKKVIIQ